MATPTGPCLSPWRYSTSLPHGVFILNKRKASEVQNMQDTAKRRCFPQMEKIPTCKQEAVNSENLGIQSNLRLPSQCKTVIECQPVSSCGHDSLLHDSYPEIDPVSHQHDSENSNNFMSESIERTRVAGEDIEMDLDEKELTSTKNKGSNYIHTQGNKASLQQRAEQLESVLEFLKENDICSNDYWAVPSALAMEEELENARIAMETDCVPNVEQYRDYSKPCDTSR